MATKAPPFDVEAFLGTNQPGHHVSTYKKGQRIYAQADPADAVFYIRKGKVKITVTSKQGKEAVVAVHAPGDFFGEGCLIGQPLCVATATALTDCTAMRIAKVTMLETLRTQVELSGRFMAYLLTRNSRVEEDLVDHLFNSSEKRLARLLLLLAKFGKEGRPELIDPKIDQAMLAEMIGTTRSRVSYFMNKFRKLGFIEYNGTIEVHSGLLSILLRD